ncbi:MAG: protein kinase [Planctomycetes bacterium]|nr:protein kinase [Planctomycetota bacterium]
MVHDGVRRRAPITEYCNARDPAFGTPRTLRGRLPQVQHAHQKGVLHRDLKPQNVLVTTIDGEPIRKLIDFGIARALDDEAATGLTAKHGCIVGTPQYMSPEQLGGSGAVDTRSTCTVSAHCCTNSSRTSLRFGERTSMAAVSPKSVAWSARSFPYRRWSVATARFRARPGPMSGRDQAHPRFPFRLRHHGEPLHGEVELPPRPTLRAKEDLDWMTLKALAKEPDQRYPSVGALLLDSNGCNAISCRGVSSDSLLPSAQSSFGDASSRSASRPSCSRS